MERDDGAEEEEERQQVAQEVDRARRVAAEGLLRGDERQLERRAVVAIDVLEELAARARDVVVGHHPVLAGLRLVPAQAVVAVEHETETEVEQERERGREPDPAGRCGGRSAGRAGRYRSAGRHDVRRGAQRRSLLTTRPSITTPTQCVVYSNGSPS